MVDTINGLIPLADDGFRPSDEMRRQITLYAWNDTPIEDIAKIFDMAVPYLLMHFRMELDHGRQRLMMWAASNVVELAGMVREEPAVALKANALLLQTKNGGWRVPKDVPAPPEAAAKPITKMNLEEVDEQIAAIMARRQSAAGPPPEEAAPDEGED